MDELTSRVYDELRQLAAAQLARERKGHTLQPTALANEAYLRMVDVVERGFDSRAHFFGIAARAMRQVLVDHARTRDAKKRGGDHHRVTMSALAGLGVETPVDVLDLDEALEELARLDERRARILELRYFAGLNRAEVAAALGVSETTVQDDWFLARAWLKTRLK